MLFEPLAGEVSEVLGDDDVRPAGDRRCKHVSIVGIGERESVLEGFPDHDTRIWEGTLHRIQSTLRGAIGNDFRMYAAQDIRKFRHHCLTPEWSEQSSIGKAQ